MQRSSFSYAYLLGSTALLASALSVAVAVSGHPSLVDSASAAPKPKVQICHIVTTDPPEWQTILVGPSSLGSHLAHDDIGGACDGHCETLCDDGNACTVDDCNVTGDACVHAPVDCTDGNLCTADSCDPVDGCGYQAMVGTVCPVNDSLPCTQATGLCVADQASVARCDPDVVPDCCELDEECADTDLCTIEACVNNECAGTGDIICSTDACHVSACNPTTGDCSVPQEIICQELECHVTACDPGIGCVSVPLAGCCTSDAECDDSNNCTTDACLGEAGCTNDPCAAGDACTVLLSCAPDCTPTTEPVYCEDDGDLCTLESCAEGQGCVSESVPCAEGTECDPATGGCITVNALAGSEFILVFQDNYQRVSALFLYISSEVPATGVVEITSIGFSEPFSVTPGVVAEVSLPAGSDLNTVDLVEVDAAVRVAADNEIRVSALNLSAGTTDAFAALPVSSLGEQHRVMAWPGNAQSLAHRSQLAVAATQDGTNVTITPAADVGTHLAGVPYMITLDRLDAYQLMAGGDLTGSLIESDAPIAVFGGNQCGQIPLYESYCDHLAEQTPPIELWGTEALSVPLATRSGGDTFRALAAQDNTTVVFDGPSPSSIVLNAGEYADVILDGNNRITADGPILVAQYSNGTGYDGAQGDPFMMLLPPANRFLDSYTFSTPLSLFANNYVNIVALTTDAFSGAVVLDGAPILAGYFTAMPGSPYAGAQVPISVGAHTLHAPNPLGLYVYGFANYNAYGYSGGFSAIP